MRTRASKRERVYVRASEWVSGLFRLLNWKEELRKKAHTKPAQTSFPYVSSSSCVEEVLAFLRWNLKKAETHPKKKMCVSSSSSLGQMIHVHSIYLPRGTETDGAVFKLKEQWQWTINRIICFHIHGKSRKKSVSEIRLSLSICVSLYLYLCIGTLQMYLPNFRLN